MATQKHIKEIVDKLGTLKAAIKDLQDQEAVYKSVLAKQGVGEYEGDLFRANVFTQERANPDDLFKEKIDSLIEKHISRQFIKAHTVEKTVTCVGVTARKTS